MRRAQIIRELQSARELRAECPKCLEEFSLHEALIFDGAEDPPEQAVEIIEQRKEAAKDWAADLREEEAELKRRKHSATEGAEKKAMEIGLGFVVEKIVTGWKTFPHRPFDCRPLFEPIDYVAFDGMTAKGKVDSVAFLDVKTGNSRLNKHQRLIRDAIQEGRVDYREV